MASVLVSIVFREQALEQVSIPSTHMFVLLQSVKLVWSVGSHDLLHMFAKVIHETSVRNPKNMFSVNLFNSAPPMLDTYHDDFSDVRACVIGDTAGYLSFGPLVQCVVHALKGLACRVRVTPASSPASHCKQS
jgi:hypothetical protein